MREGGAATKGTSSGSVADAHDADVVHTSNGALASHARRHLDLEGEVGVRGQGNALDAETWDVLRDLGILEGVRIRASRGGINSSIQGAGAILVDLGESRVSRERWVKCR